MSAENVNPEGFDSNRSWDVQANCLDVVPDTFFPEGTYDEIREESLEAKRICAQCLARLACYEYAKVNHHRAGVWGGLNEIQRKALRRSKRRMTLNQLDILIKRS